LTCGVIDRAQRPAHFLATDGASRPASQKENAMEQAQEIANRYIAVWHERDAQIRRDLIARLWVEDGLHYVGEREARGYDALEKRITGSHEKNVRDGDNRFRAGNARALRDVVTFDWEMIPAGGGEVLATGREILLLAEDRRILADYQFVLT
jgi:hypothetical protein